mgnify:CR=1 FL=1|jgi:DNA repair exonuclease SbcCD ATPase subunit
MKEELWRAYLEEMSEEDLRLCAQLVELPVRGYRKEHKNTPRQVLLNNFYKYPLLTAKMPDLCIIRKKLKDETENKIDKVKEKLLEYFEEFSVLKVSAALASSEEEELQELGEKIFKIWPQQDTKTEDQKEPSEAEKELTDKLEKSQAEVEQQKKKLKRTEKQHKELKVKHEKLQIKYDNEREKLKKKTAEFQEKIAQKEEEISSWKEKYSLLEKQLAKLEKEKAQLEQELAKCCQEVLIVGMGGSPTERKRIGTQLVNLHYLDCQEQTDIERIIQDKDHIFLQSAGIPHLLRNQLYCLCLRAGKQPLEVAGEEELELKLKRALGVER